MIEDSLPCAITVDMIKKEIVNDKDMKLLYECISTQNKGRVKKNLKQYVGVFPELYLYNGIILKGSQILIPPAFHSEVVGIAHEGHQYADKTLSLLRQTCWFPKMRKCVLEYVESCIGCLAAIPQVTSGKQLLQDTIQKYANAAASKGSTHSNEIVTLQLRWSYWCDYIRYDLSWKAIWAMGPDLMRFAVQSTFNNTMSCPKERS